MRGPLSKDREDQGKNFPFLFKLNCIEDAECARMIIELFHNFQRTLNDLDHETLEFEKVANNQIDLDKLQVSRASN